MADLSAEKREDIPSKHFGLPEKARTTSAKKESGNYPMPDEGHAISALRLAKKHRTAGKLSKADYERIRRKAHKILKKQ